MSAHEIVYATVYCIYYQMRYSPRDCAQLALKAADEAVALRDTLRGTIPQVHQNGTQSPAAVSGSATQSRSPTFNIPSSVSPPSPVAAVAALASRPLEPTMASALASMPAGIGPIVDTTVVEAAKPNETIAGWAARTPGAEDVLRKLRETFGVIIQDAPR